jgi:hypothetical protein
VTQTTQIFCANFLCDFEKNHTNIYKLHKFYMEDTQNFVWFETTQDLCGLRHALLVDTQICYMILEISEICFSVFLKNSEFFLEKYQKNFKVRLGRN